MAESSQHVLMLMPCCETRGSTVQALTLAQGLRTRGFRVTVISTNAAQVGPERREGITLLERPSLGWKLMSPLTRRFLLRDLKDDPPAVIHAQHRNQLPLARWLATEWKCPVVLSVHDYLNPGESLNCDATFPAAVVAVSESVREELLTRAPLPPERVQVIHGG